MNTDLYIPPARCTREIQWSWKSHRITGGDPPHPFPTELWTQIIDECSSRQEWSQLCKTCRFFFRIAQGLLYKNITLIRFQGRKNGLDCSLYLFDKLLKNRPELGALVHDFRVTELYPPLRREYPLVSYLHQLPNLKALRVQGHEFSIDSDLCYAIHSHPHLSAVSFSLCTLANSLLGLRNEQFPQSSISDLEVTDLHSADYGWVALAPTELRSLKVSCRIRPDHPVESILSGIASAGKNRMLEELSIERLPKSITDFLITVPRLRKLTIGSSVDADHPIFPSLPSDAIPLLEHYTGPAELSPLLLRNRPVHTVSWINNNNNRKPNIHCFAALHLSSVPVTKLEVPNALLSHWLWELPITIHHLTLATRKQFFMKQLAALSRFNNLHTVRLIMRHHADSQENMSREEIMTTSNICPSLREFELPHVHKRWVMVKAGVWEHFIGY